MKVVIGSDHAGFELKNAIGVLLASLGHEVLDVGAYNESPSDYPDYAEAVGKAVLDGRAERGVLICGSGVGATVAANKIHGARAALIMDTFSARQGVEDDDMNVLCLGARVIGISLATELAGAFLAARYSGAERHAVKRSASRFCRAFGLAGSGDPTYFAASCMIFSWVASSRFSVRITRPSLRTTIRW